MRCSNCGAENQSGNFCMKCGSSLAYTQYVGVGTPLASTMVLALVSMALCVYLGIPSTLLMVFSRDAFHMGDMDKYTRYNRYSRVCAIVGIVLAVLVFVLYVAFMGMVVAEDINRI